VRVSIDFTEGRLANKNDSRNPWTGRDMLQDFIDLNNRVLDRFSAEERANIGIHTCPGGDMDSVHSKEVPYDLLLSKMFQLNAGYFLIQCASEDDRESVYEMVGRYSRDDADGVPQVCFMGVINPLSPEVETAEHVRDELLTAAKHIPVERIGATDDCGFSPFSRDEKPRHGSPDFARDVAMRKIAARLAGAAMAREELGVAAGV
jgi:methionine synthase II (cobalamin-independent)